MCRAHSAVSQWGSGAQVRALAQRDIFKQAMIGGEARTTERQGGPEACRDHNARMAEPDSSFALIL